MAKYVKTDYVPDEAMFYITAGKEYIVLDGDETGGYFIDDEGNKQFAFYPMSRHIRNRPWTVINR